MPGEASAPDERRGGLSAVDEMIELVRRQLGMDVAFVSQVLGDTRTFRNIRSVVDLPIGAGDAEPFSGTYCQMIVDGQLDEVVPDTAADVLVRDAFHTGHLGIGSYVGVPMRRADGTFYGTLCTFSREPDPRLQQRDGAVLAAMATVVMTLVESEDDEAQRRAVLGAAVDAAVGGAATIRLDPVLRLQDRRLAGHEARVVLADGGTATERRAAAVGIGREVELETYLLRGLRGVLPAGTARTWWRTTAPALTAPAVLEALEACDPTRLVLVVSAGDPAADLDDLAEALQPLRRAGLQLCVDHVGHAGTGIEHVLMLEPELIGLDGTLTRGLADSPQRQRVVEALAALAARLDARSVAGALESPDDLMWAEDLGVAYGRGPAVVDAEPRRGDNDLAG